MTTSGFLGVEPQIRKYLTSTATMATTLTLSSTTHATKGHVAVADPMALLNGTAPTNSPANLIQIYAEDVGGSSELKVRDEAGDVTVLSEPASTVQFVIDGGGGTITTGDKGHLEAPFNCTLTGGHGMADQSGSIKVRVYKDTFANFPPDSSDEIAHIEITTATNVAHAETTGWTTAVTQGDIFGFNVDSVTSIQRVTVSLRCDKI